MNTTKEVPHRTNNKTTEIKDRKGILTTLWMFAMFNYLYADVLTLMDSEVLSELMRGYMGTVHITQEFLFVGAILMETAIVMVLLSRVLNYKANRWANIVVGSLHTVVVLASILGTPPAPYYLFHGVIEIGCTAFIVWYAWKWVNPQAQP